MQKIASTQRESMEFDILIVGAGIAGLSAAIALKQKKPNCNIAVLEKAANIGAHILSGALFDPSALEQLFPNWLEESDIPLKTKVTEENLIFLTEKNAFPVPHFLIPENLKNKNTYVTSLGELCQWLAKKAEDLGVEIYPGFAAVDFLTDDQNNLVGVVTGDMGVDKKGEKKENFEPGIEIIAKYTLIAEGARGSLAREIIKYYQLDKNSDPQKYGLGIKEIWQITPEKHKKGTVIHSVGWPLKNDIGGGSFLYHLDDNKIAIGMIVHLDYKNPYLSPFAEFQNFKTHPFIKTILENGKPIAYGAKAVTEGGWQSVPQVAFPGGVLLGCSAGYMNLARLKGAHNAMFSAIYAAHAIAQALDQKTKISLLNTLNENWKNKEIGKDLFPARNIKPLWKKFGTKLGLTLSAIDLYCQKYLKFSPYGTLHLKKADYEWLEAKEKHHPIPYPKADNIYSFDILQALSLANVTHEEDQPTHLKIKRPEKQLTSELEVYGGPSAYYCPAKVYEWREQDGEYIYQINASNCLHCKTCDIKDPNQNIKWTCPQGGEGPNYCNM